MRIFQSVTAVTPNARGLDATLDDGWRLRVRALSDDLLRVVIEPAGGLPLDRTWMIAPEGETPWGGRNRDDASGFTPGAVDVVTADGVTILTAGNFRLTLTGAPLRLAVDQRVGGVWRPWIRDRTTGGFALTEHDTRVRHFQQRDASGRTNEVLLQGDGLITFWSDHATCEIHVVNLEQVED